MFLCPRRESLGELLLNCLAKLTLPKSIENYLGDVFFPNGTSNFGFGRYFKITFRQKLHQNQVSGLHIAITSGIQSCGPLKSAV